MDHRCARAYQQGRLLAWQGLLLGGRALHDVGGHARFLCVLATREDFGAELLGALDLVLKVHSVVAGRLLKLCIPVGLGLCTGLRGLLRRHPLLEKLALRELIRM